MLAHGRDLLGRRQTPSPHIRVRDIFRSVDPSKVPCGQHRHKLPARSWCATLSHLARKCGMPRQMQQTASTTPPQTAAGEVSRVGTSCVAHTQDAASQCSPSRDDSDNIFRMIQRSSGASPPEKPLNRAHSNAATKRIAAACRSGTTPPAESGQTWIGIRWAEADPSCQLSGAARCRLPCVPTRGTSARSRVWRGALDRSATTSSLMGFAMSPVSPPGQTTRRFAKSTPSYSMLVISAMRTARRPADGSLTVSYGLQPSFPS